VHVVDCVPKRLGAKSVLEHLRNGVRVVSDHGRVATSANKGVEIGEQKPGRDRRQRVQVQAQHIVERLRFDSRLLVD
jgi:hypothetical protein